MAFRTVDIMGNELTKFACTVCLREYLPASEFSEPQLAKCAEQEVKNNEASTIELLRATCKSCALSGKEAEAAAAAERQAASQAIANESQWEVVPISLVARPFGMTAAGASDSAGYRVARATAGKPAAEAGVVAGWRLVSIGGVDVRELPLKDAQLVLKDTPLPAELCFERPPSDWHFCVGCSLPCPPEAFSRKMLTKPADKRRCSACVQSTVG
uniref:PDZ domain-containing protein n=1 Tax=Noctiluca scintillans TaxID=2966 RepID=A0A7S1A3T4_NOCSC|mmetsp:Transcript_3043/g.8811  ORF Transcript_3043/g.8811 Transcript_3043/m.8811 type:complete len:214 (+) Transcript_3043:70-711(+)